jgi:isoleucyl-tRNA synthetase
VTDDQLTTLDRWVLSEFAKLEDEVAAAFDRFEFHVVYQRVSQFVAVELSAIYHDVVKDRLYTDPSNSPRRRSTQTALHRMVAGLCKMLAPVLVFSIDEAWEFVPGRTVESAQQLTWQPSRFELREKEAALWTQLLLLRDLALNSLEQARQAKTIGKALDAKLTLSGPRTELQEVAAHVEILRELLNVSALVVELTDGTATQVTLAKADGQKCERCWHWETDVGSTAEHPTICKRCVKAVEANSAPA